MTRGARVLRTAAPLLAASLVIAGCPSTRGRGAPPPPAERIDVVGDRPYCTGGEGETRRLRALVDRLATASAADAIETGKAIVSRGEAAIPLLLEGLRGPEPRLRGASAYLLGVLKDRRTVPALETATADPVPSVRYEAAGALLEMQDPNGLSVLVDGLLDPDARLRAKCLDVLQEKTAQTFGFEADAAPDERAAAVRRWRAWLAAREADAPR
jgi:hypothetical protein